MDQDSLRSIASGMVTNYREASFGRGYSSWSTLHNLSWDPVAEAFVQRNKYDMLSRQWDVTSHPCSKELAENILRLCATEEVRKRFLENYYAETPDTELYMCGDQVVGFNRGTARRGRTSLRYDWLATFSFSFYSPDWTLQHIGFNFELGQSFSKKTKELSPDALNEIFRPVSKVA